MIFLFYLKRRADASAPLAFAHKARRPVGLASAAPRKNKLYIGHQTDAQRRQARVRARAYARIAKRTDVRARRLRLENNPYFARVQSWP